MLCDLRVGVVLGDRRIWLCIESAPSPIELALAIKVQQVLTRDAYGLDVAGSHDSVLADILHGSLKWLRRGHGINPPLFNHL